MDIDIKKVTEHDLYEAYGTIGKFATTINRQDDRIKELENVIKRALRIKDIWLIDEKHVKPEHEGEADALAKMHMSFEVILEK